MFGDIRKYLKRRRDAIEKRRVEQARERERLERERRRAIAEQEAARRRHEELNERGRNLQISFFQLPQSPDLQRQRSWASQSTVLPLAFRRRQFGRFKSLFQTECTRMIHSGASREAILHDLRGIVVAMGVASFEADYIINAIPVAAPTPLDPNAEFQRRLNAIHTEYQQRLNSIRAMQNLEEDVREELLATEEQRYRSLLFGRLEFDQFGKFADDKAS